MRKVARVVALVCALGALAAPVTSAAQSQAVADCNAHGHLTRHYTVAQLRTALVTMSADVKEYTDCYDVIQRQLLAQLAAVHGGGGGGSDSGSGGSFLPTPLIVLLVLLALAAATFGAIALRRRGSAGPSEP